MRASFWLAPGDYWVSLQGPKGGSEVLRLTPWTVPEDGGATLRLDVSRARDFVMVPRTSEGGIPSKRAASGLLHLCGTSVVLGIQGGHALVRRRAVAAPSYAVVHTFGRAPTEVVLAMEAGLQGRSVVVRPVRFDERLPGAHLVVEVPEVHQVSAPFESIAGGRIQGAPGGWGFADDTIDAGGPAIWGPQSRVVRRVADGRRLAVLLSGEREVGWVVEAVRGKGWMVRDWFIATPDRLLLVGEGEGRFVEVSSTLKTAVTLVWTPEDPSGAGLRPCSAGALAAGSTRKLWVPRAAASLGWYRRDEWQALARRGVQPLVKLAPLGRASAPFGTSMVLE